MRALLDPAPTTIVKLGGSLLGLPDLAARLTNVLGDFARRRSIVVVGGGAMVDELRRLHRVYPLGSDRRAAGPRLERELSAARLDGPRGEETWHWLALRALSITSRVVAGLSEDFCLVSAPEECPPLWLAGKTPVYDAFHFIADVDEPSDDPLPRRWRVTSDSIAARMAVRFRAAELVLLKSIDAPTEGLSFREAAEQGLVDPHFPTAARDVPRTVLIHLRAEEPEERELRPSFE